MNREVLAAFSGYCPYLEKNHTIKVKFTEIDIMGQTATEYIRSGYSCTLQSECNSRDEYGQCELYLSTVYRR